MRTIIDMLEAFEKVDVDDEIQQALIDTADELVILQKDQLKSGLTEEEEPIKRLSTGSAEYSPRYAKYKGRKKPIDLHDTSDFYHGIFTDVRQEGIVIDSADEKSGMLQKEYGEEIFGLGEKRSNEYNEVAGPALLNRIETKLE